jgi:putative transposase
MKVARSNLIERRGRQAAPALSQGQGRARIGADPPAGGRAADLRVPAYYATGEPAAKGRRQVQYQCQAGAADHASQPTDPGTRHWALARTHDGIVIALRSNVRWCSDHFELACRNGEIVRVLFAIDACDRENHRLVGTVRTQQQPTQ